MSVQVETERVLDEKVIYEAILGGNVAIGERDELPDIKELAAILSRYLDIAEQKGRRLRLILSVTRW